MSNRAIAKTALVVSIVGTLFAGGQFVIGVLELLDDGSEQLPSVASTDRPEWVSCDQRSCAVFEDRHPKQPHPGSSAYIDLDRSVYIDLDSSWSEPIDFAGPYFR